MREERVLSPLAFNQLLSWLDDGADSQGEAYLEMRRRLVAYFDRRNRLAADDLADEVLNRVARTLETDGFIATRPPARNAASGNGKNVVNTVAKSNSRPGPRNDM